MITKGDVTQRGIGLLRHSKQRIMIDNLQKEKLRLTISKNFVPESAVDCEIFFQRECWKLCPEKH